jgi:hypothetical protein
MAERVGFEPTCRLPDKTLSRRPRYDHFGTSPYRACSPRLTPQPSGSAVGEERLHQLTAFLLEHPGRNLDLVVQCRIVEHGHRRPHGTGPRLRRTVNESADAGVHQGTGAHQTRLDGDKQLSPGQAVIADRGRRVSQRDDFCVGGRVAAANRLIASAANDDAVSYDDGPDRHFVAVARQPRLHERLPHERFVRRAVDQCHRFVPAYIVTDHHHRSPRDANKRRTRERGRRSPGSPVRYFPDGAADRPSYWVGVSSIQMRMLLFASMTRTISPRIVLSS